MGVKHQPRQLLSQVRDLNLEEMPDAETCCGFGGSFCVKFPRISERIVTDKTLSIQASGADTLLGGDLGCLLNMAGHLKRTGSKVRVYHAAEVLADMTSNVPGLGDSKD
jgi:L-lactate dehydrogenase complex protein LldE